LTKALLPEDAGGFGIGIVDALTLLRVAAAHAAPVPLAETMLAGWLLARAGIVVPDGVLSLGPVRAAEQAVLTQDGDGWRISGTLTRVPWARHASALAVLARQGDACWVALVAPDSWTLGRGENTAHEPRDTVHLDGAVIAAAPVALSCDELQAAGAAIRTQQMAGALTRLTDITVQYAQDRVQFGKPIGKFQAIQQNLAVLAGQTAAAVAGADIAADALADGPRIMPIAAGKARAGDAAGIGAGIAHQVHGAIGLTFEHNLHFLTRRLWAWRDEFGRDAVWQRLLGLRMAQAGADQLWPAITG
jgi:acyl-CoA dehydrogenase